MKEITLEQRIQAIEERNKSVKLDKAWETSWTRRGLIIAFTYISLAAYMWAIGADKPFVNAIVPAAGFTLSTLSLPYFRRIWERNH
jgi:hypothetical protein